MTKFKIAFNHLKTITKHKKLVTISCFRAGLIIQGIKHDLSKYSRLEFWGSVKYWTGTNSPIDNEKKDKGYSMLWLNHKAKNKHHWEYWTDFKYGVPYAAKIPKKYLVEHILDGIAAGKVYGGDNYKKTSLGEFIRREDHRLYNSETKDEIFRLVLVYENKSTRDWYKYLRRYLKTEEYVNAIIKK